MGDRPSADLTFRIIGAAYRVHSVLGPGLLESVYESALCEELQSRRFKVNRQVYVPVVYCGKDVASDLRLDILVDDQVIIEVKSIQCFEAIHRAQALTYLKLTGHSLCLLLNFNVLHLRDGIRRVIR